MSELEQRLTSVRLDLAEAELKRLTTPKERDSFWSNPLLLAIAGATATAIFGLISTKTQFDANRQLERDKLESSLILKAIDTADPAERLTALQFLVKAGLISDLQGKIATLKADEIPRIQEQATDLSSYKHLPIAFSNALVERILKSPAVPYPTGVKLARSAAGHIKAIVLHYSYGPDVLDSIKFGNPGIPGPLAHWIVFSDGTIKLAAPESERAFHVGQASRGITNSNSIGIQTSGPNAFGDERQIETLLRLVLDVADRWSVPTDMIVSHAEVAMPVGRKADMLQQAPEIRRMIDAIRSARKTAKRQ